MYNLNVTLLQHLWDSWKWGSGCIFSAHRILIYRQVAAERAHLEQGKNLLGEGGKNHYNYARPQLSMQDRLRTMQSEKTILPRHYGFDVMLP
jgi:hypothetical protein